MSNKKIRVSLRKNRSSWSDLPQEICELICNKLPIYRDQIYFRAVCKTWKIPSAGLRRCSKYHTWLISLSKEKQDVNLFDPCAQQVYKISTSLHKFYLKMPDVNSIQGHYYFAFYASKNGWLLLSLGPCEETGCLILYNPFLNDIISLPKLLSVEYMAATFTMDPKSPGCEVFVLCTNLPINNANSYINTQCIARYCVSRDKEWNIKNTGTTSCGITNGMLSVDRIHYMKGKLYCLFGNGVLLSYDMKDESVKSLSQEFPIHAPIILWLTEHEEHLIAVCKDRQPWMIYRFDLLLNSWVFENSLKNAAIFVNSSVAIAAPLVDGELDDCHMCYLKDGKPVETFSMKEMKRISSKHYWAMSTAATMGFIEPPCVSNN